MKTKLIRFAMHTVHNDNTTEHNLQITEENTIFVGFSDEWSESNIAISKAITNLVDEDFDITSISTYYRFPKLNLSRDKMSMLKDSKDIKKVLDKDKADLLVVSTKYLSSLISFEYKTSLSSVGRLRELLHKKQISEGVSNQLLEICKDMAPSDNIIIRNDLGYYGNSQAQINTEAKGVQDLISSLRVGESRGYGSYVGHIQEHNIEHWESITNSSKFIIQDKMLNNIASTDSVIIDNEIYCSIVKMLKGTNEDRTLAMSTMANCNVSKSKGYLALLFFHFYDTFKANSSWNHVAFKGLKDQFSNYIIDYGYHNESRYSEFINRLAKKDALTVEIVNHITHLMFDNVLKSAFGPSGSSVFRLKNVDIDIIDNCKDKVVDSYTTLISAPTYALPF